MLRELWFARSFYIDDSRVLFREIISNRVYTKEFFWVSLSLSAQTEIIS